jgi:hypothetical protein
LDPLREVLRAPLPLILEESHPSTLLLGGNALGGQVAALLTEVELEEGSVEAKLLRLEFCLSSWPEVVPLFPMVPPLSTSCDA